MIKQIQAIETTMIYLIDIYIYIYI
jgi:hypothetical protein